MNDTTPTCANCGIPIQWLPTVVGGQTYCCLGCAEGGPCECDYASLPQPDDPAALSLVRREEQAGSTPDSTGK